MHVNEQIIREHLTNILESREFQRKPTLQRFLRFIVEKTLSGQAHEIKGYAVATQVFGKGSDFDPLRDAIVRVQARRLRTALERYYQYPPGQAFPLRIKIPKGTYVPTLEHNSWEGPRLDQPLKTAANELGETVRGPSIAVMPLLNLSGDPSQDYFVDGLTDEMVSELARYQDLRVIASHSTLRWKNREYDPHQVAKELGVRFLVEGSVRRDIETIKISIWLADITTGMQIWGEQYRRELRANSLITLQEDIGRRVAARVGSQYGIVLRTLSLESRHRPPESLATYEAFLRFFHHMTVLSAETYLDAFSAIETATTREPDCGLTWSFLAVLYCQNHTLELASLETSLEKALDFARRGVSLEPQNQWARTALANAYFFLEERRPFLREAIAALDLNSNSPSLIGLLGWMLALYGEWKQGLAILRKAIELNPYYPGWLHSATYFDYFRQGKYAEAYREAQQFQMPLLFWDPLLRAAALGQLGRKAEAGKAVAELLQLRPDFAARGQQFIAFYVKAALLRDGLLDGLRKAGLRM